MNEEFLDLIKNNPEEPEVYKNIKEALENEEKEIDIPNKADLFTDKVQIQSLTRLVDINGVQAHPIFAFVTNMLNIGSEPVICIVGDTGMGKSMAALVFADTLHEANVLRGDFDPSEQTFYNPIEYGLFIRNHTRTAIMMDEANETLNSNQYNSKLNNMVAGSLRTQRKRENAHIFVGPELGEFDPRIRRNADVVINMEKKRVGRITIYDNKNDKRDNRGLDYFFDKNLPRWEVPDVKPELAEEYEKTDNDFKGRYLDRLILKALKEKEEEMEEEYVSIS